MMGQRPRMYRVRVMRVVETWIDVSAISRAGAELAAASFPGVITVFAKSAIQADRGEAEEPLNVEGDDERGTADTAA